MRHVANPPNPWLSTHVEWIGEPPEAKTEVFEEEATRSIITRNHSPDVGFDYSVNIYRGCTHACSYCFSRPTHEYLGFGAGTDFERKIVVKVNAPQRLREEMLKLSWRGDQIVFSFTSDPYLPLEANYKLTRACLKVCLEFRNPVGIVTKSALIRRDADLLAALARQASCAVFFTIGFSDNATARAVEPHAPSVDSRFKAMEELARAGVPVGIGLAPVIPGLNDPHIPQLLRRAKECGADHAFINLLRLPGSVAPYFEQRLRERLPERADRVLKRLREMRGGRLNVAEFGKRMTGEGAYWEMIEQSFRLHARRLGFNRDAPAHHAPPRTFRRPCAQGSLFD